MMRFSIGYQLPDEDDSILEIARDFPEHMGEVYFATPGEASGRSPIGTDPEAREAMDVELAALSEMGVGLVLLFNAACYGDGSLSRDLAARVCRQTGALLARCRVTAVTTTSPFIAKTLKGAFPALEMRASVNMRIGTIKGMQYQGAWFDGFYLQREYNRDPERIEELKGWCDENGKSLHLLANSGCLIHCSSQTFHDNLVAHEAGICQKENVPARYPSPCWEFLADRANWAAFLQNTWIRPEDLRHYERWFATAKLATRMHANPRRVVSAYARGRYRGNLLDLMEPGYAPLFRGFTLDNARFPEDWHRQVTECDKACHRCHYCAGVLEQVLVDVEKTYGS